MFALLYHTYNRHQAVFFSTRNAQREQQVNAGYITDEFVALLHSLHSLVSTSLDKRVQATYRYRWHIWG